MVNNPDPRRLLAPARYPCHPGDRQKIEGPVYDLDIVKALVKLHPFVPVNEVDRGMRRFAPPLQEADIPLVIAALKPDMYVESEYCDKTTRGLKVEADAYRIRWSSGRKAIWEYADYAFIKFGFKANIPKCLIISIHPSDW
jgi:hypothetical protein